VRKKETRSGVGIQHNTTTTIIVTRCHDWLLMKWESAGELPIRPQSSFIYYFLSFKPKSYFAKNVVTMVFGRVKSYLSKKGKKRRRKKREHDNLQNVNSIRSYIFFTNRKKIEQMVCCNIL